MSIEQLILRFRDLILVLMFFGVILSSSMAWFFLPAGEAKNIDNRRLNPYPTPPDSIAKLGEYPPAFEDWYNDHFGLRVPLINAHNIFHYSVLGTSPTDRVIAGKDGWLFLTASNEQAYTRARPVNQAQLARYTAHLEERNQMLADRGIRFLFVVVPNKRTIYPEYLPISGHPLTGESGMDQLLEYLAANSEIETMDLRPMLEAEKQSSALYHKTDSHCTDFGSLLIANAILTKLGMWFDGLEPYPLTDYDYHDGKWDGDLIKMIGLEGMVLEPTEHITPPARRQRSISNLRSYPGYESYNRNKFVSHRYFFYTNSEKKLRAVLMRDSFGHRFAPYLAEHFDRLVLTPRDELKEDVLEREDPHIVIMQLVERNLHSPGGLYDDSVE